MTSIPGEQSNNSCNPSNQNNNTYSIGQLGTYPSNPIVLFGKYLTYHQIQSYCPLSTRHEEYCNRPKQELSIQARYQKKFIFYVLADLMEVQTNDGLSLAQETGVRDLITSVPAIWLNSQMCRHQERMWRRSQTTDVTTHHPYNIE